MLNISKMEISPAKNTATARDESGVAALFVVMILMTVLALISVGFSQLMNREVRQSLDRQLSTEAFYAAESGVNDARNYLSTAGATSFAGCATPADNNFVSEGNVSGDNLAKYTCASVDVTPKELNYDLAPGESRSIKVDLATMATLHLGWANQTYTNDGIAKPMTTTGGASPLGTLPREDEIVDNSTGILRIGLYPVPAGAAASPDTNAALAAASRNYFLYPTAGGGSEGTVSFGDTARNGTFISGNCNTTHPNNYLPYAQATNRFCNSAISDLSGAGTTYYLRITAIYEPISVSIEASDSSNTALGIPNTEAIIDVTGSGNDVLKRIRALVPIGDNFDYPSNALQSMQAVCKLFRVEVVAPGTYGNTTTESAPNDDGSCATPLNSGFVQGGGIGSLGDIPCVPPKVGNYPDCVNPPPPPPPPPPPSPAPPHINSFQWNGGVSFTYNVSNSNYCEIHTDNPPGGVQPFAPVLNTNFPATAGNGGNGTLFCWDQGLGPDTRRG